MKKKKRIIPKNVRLKISLSMKGRKLSSEHIEKMRINATGKKHSEETKRKMSLSRKGKKLSKTHIKNIIKGRLKSDYREEKHWRWKGDKVGYLGLHRWVEAKLGKPKECSFCKTTKVSTMYDWANKSHTYKREISDWIRLCRKCHVYYDKK